MKIILDTNVIVSGIFFSGPPYEILKSWRNGKFKITGDKHLLNVNGYEGLEIIRPREFVEKYI